MPEDVRRLFTDDYDEYVFGPPCSEAEVEQAEAALGEPLPPHLRELYLAFNGFTGCTGAAFLWPLFGELSLVVTNQLYRGDGVFPQAITSGCLFFGDNGCRQLWAFKRDAPGRVVRWNLSWPDAVEDAGDSPLAAWAAEKQIYDELASEGEE
ncbi:MAG: hypothetical protein C0467_20585 [Planctomycetaceae bacterium]|nr:hypothetical protein [Planctomycetaceae bacterium]